MANCETNVIQLQDVTLASMTNNGNGTHSFNPGDENLVTFSTKNVSNASFNSVSRLLTLTLTNGDTVTVTIPSAITASDPTPADGLISVNIAGVDYVLAENFTEISGPDVDGNFTATHPDGTTKIWAKSVFRKVLVPATSTSSGTVNDIAFDSNYVYICYATNQWVRAPLNSW